MPWRSRSLMIADEVLEREVGEQRRHLRRRHPNDQEAKKPMSAAVTAPMATMRVARREF